MYFHVVFAAQADEIHEPAPLCKVRCQVLFRGVRPSLSLLVQKPPSTQNPCSSPVLAWGADVHSQAERHLGNSVVDRKQLRRPLLQSSSQSAGHRASSHHLESEMCSQFSLEVSSLRRSQRCLSQHLEKQVVKTSASRMLRFKPCHSKFYVCLCRKSQSSFLGAPCQFDRPKVRVFMRLTSYLVASLRFRWRGFMSEKREKWDAWSAKPVLTYDELEDDFNM